MECFRFKIPGIPQPQLRARHTVRGQYVHIYDPPKCRAAKKRIREIITMQAFDEGVKQPLEGPLSVEIDFGMPIPKSLKKRVKDNDPHIKRPDVDNLTKLVLDAITDSGVIWRDDSQVYSISATKTYSTKPHTTIHIFKGEQ